MDDDDQHVSHDVSPHDDFDLQEIFSNLSTEVPKIEEILSEAKKFGDSHRFLINKFIQEPSMLTKKMNLLFAQHVTTVKLKRHPDAVMKIAATPETSRDLTKTILKAFSKEKGAGRNGFRPWRFVTSTNEKSPNEYVTMTGCTQNSTIISDASDMVKTERCLLLTILDEMINNDGTVKMKRIHDLCREDRCKMTGQKCDQFLMRMRRLNYFEVDYDSGVVEITPRILAELEPWLRAKYVGELKICELCRKIIARPIYTAECKKCHVLYHYNCFKTAVSISKKDSVECQKCKEMLGVDDVEEQVEKRKMVGVPSKKSRSSKSMSNSDGKSRKRSRNDESNKDDIDDVDMENNNEMDDENMDED